MKRPLCVEPHLAKAGTESCVGRHTFDRSTSKENLMKRSSALLLLLISFTFLGSVPAFGQACPPRGSVIVGPTGFFDHIANGDPASTACWTLTNAVFVSMPACTPFGPPPYNAFQLNYASGVSQQFTIPANMTSPTLDLAFQLDFIDPNHAAFNSIDAEVSDVTAGRSLGTFDFHGGQLIPPDNGFTCRRVDIQINEVVAGHTLQVRFTGQKGWSDTFIRVHGISFFQLPPAP
jgi:hypothetical protein